MAAIDQSVLHELNSIVGAVTSLLPGAQVILFGSYANGRNARDSDLDLCVVADTVPGRRMDLTHKLRGAVSSLTALPVDILLYRRDEFQKNSLLRPTLEYVIAREGAVLNA